MPYIILATEDLIPGIDIDAVSADSLQGTAVLMLVFPVLRDQVLRLIVRIPANSVQEDKAIPLGNTDIGDKHHSRSCIAASNGTNMSLKQIDDAIGYATRLGVQQDRLLSVQLADHEKLLPPIRLKCRKPCTRGDSEHQWHQDFAKGSRVDGVSLL